MSNESVCRTALPTPVLLINAIGEACQTFSLMHVFKVLSIKVTQCGKIIYHFTSRMFYDSFGKQMFIYFTKTYYSFKITVSTLPIQNPQLVVISPIGDFHFQF